MQHTPENILNRRILRQHLTEHLDGYMATIHRNEGGFYTALHSHYIEIYDQFDTFYSPVMNLKNCDSARRFLHFMQSDHGFDAITPLAELNVRSAPPNHPSTMFADPDIKKLIETAAEPYGYATNDVINTLIDLSRYRDTAQGDDFKTIETNKPHLFLKLESGGIPRIYQRTNQRLYEEFCSKKKAEKILANTGKYEEQLAELEGMFALEAWRGNRDNTPPAAPAP